MTVTTINNSTSAVRDPAIISAQPKGEENAWARIKNIFNHQADRIPELGLKKSYLQPKPPIASFTPQPLIHEESDGHWQVRIAPLATDFFPELNTFDQTRAHAPCATREELIASELIRQKRSAESFGIKTSKKELKNSWEGIKNSTVARPSLESRIQFQTVASGTLARLSGKEFITSYQLLQNSPLNGCKFGTSAHEEIVQHAITSSLDRYPPSMTLARKMDMLDPVTGQKETVCYAGRPDSQQKFEEETRMIFLGEYDPLTDGGPGITKDPVIGVYEVTFVMNSFISTAKAGKTEYELIEKEHQELLKFKQAVANGALVEVQKNGRVFRIKPKILFFNRQFNFTNRLEEPLPKELTGELQSEEFSNSIDDLKALLTPAQLENPLIKRSLEMLQNRKNHALSSEDELFLRTLICSLANLPILFHCRSCVDRTSIAVAMAYAIKQLQKSNIAIPLDNPCIIMDDEAFKELWYANITLGHMMTAYSRQDYGFKWQTGPLPLLTQHPAVLRLMPKRFLKPFLLDARTTSTALKLFKTNPKFAPLFCFFLPLLALRSPIKSFKEWALAPDKTGIAKVARVAYRSVALLFALVIGVAQVLLIALFGTLIAAPVYTVMSRDLKQLLLGFKLTEAVLKFMPEEILQSDIKLHGKPLIFVGKGAD